MDGKFAAAIIIGFFLVLPASMAQQEQFDPKTVESITLRITQSGQLAITGTVEKMNLTLYVPQDGVRSIDVKSNSQVVWRNINDRFGNNVMLLEWNKPSGAVSYDVTTIVKSDAKLVSSLPDIGYDQRYLNQTASIVINDDIRKLAYPFERSWDNVARLSGIVYDLIEYDITTVGKRYPSDVVLAGKRGVCVEHANLMTSLLRASGIPTRYVVGYAYSTVDRKLIGHTWVEVLGSDGRWIPFDPTWLQGGYIDATHIKTASLLDDTQLDILTYTGNGNVAWSRGGQGDLYNDNVEIIDYTLKNITSINMVASVVGRSDYGYIKAHVEPKVCTITRISVNSCIDQNNQPVFDITDQNQSFLTCIPRDAYWFFKETTNKGGYICPMTVFDQTGGIDSVEVEVLNKNIGRSNISIAGPSVVKVGEMFTISAVSDGSFIFYSKDFGKNNGKDWTLNIGRPGTYRFYLYASSTLVEKDVEVLESKPFDLTMIAPRFVKKLSTFDVTVTAKNLESGKAAKVSVEFDGLKSEKNAVFEAGREITFMFNFTAYNLGEKDITVLISADTLTPHTSKITVEGDEMPINTASRGILEAILEFFASIGDFFAGLF